MKDHPKISNGHKTELHCSQDAKKKKKAKPSKAPNIEHRDHVGMKRYDCQSRLVVTCTRGASPSTQIISVRIKHHEKHQPYFDVAMPPEAADIIRENLEWSTPSSIIPKVQAVYPQVTGKQVHKAWADMSEVLWKRDHLQLPSAKKLLQEFSDDVDVFEVNVAEGVEILCWGMKKTLARLKGKVVEIGIDATCKVLSQ